MSGLRETALAAWGARREELAYEEAARQQAVVDKALAFIARSPLGEWFPDVEWEYLGTSDNGTGLVCEKAGDRIVLGARITKDGSEDQGPDEWEVAIYRPAVQFFGPRRYEIVERVKEAADIGAYIEKHTPQPAEPKVGVAE